MGGKDVPEWVAEKIRDAEFDDPKKVKRTGYILEIYEKDCKMDAQLYEPVEDGRHIITLDLPKEIKAGTLERGTVYEFSFEAFKAPLDGKTVAYLQKQGVMMDAIFRFELQELEPVD